jgi:NADPH:quinone reductase-like Zn-dependent oxidoreductase
MSPISIPKTTKAWAVASFDSQGFESLKFNKETPLPEISDYEVLVKFHAASLNYRDLIIPKGENWIGYLYLLS